jgi:hypothetical protein
VRTFACLAAAGTLLLTVAACGGAVSSDESRVSAGYRQSQREVAVTDLATPRAKVTRQVERMTGGDPTRCKQGFTHESYKCTIETRNAQGWRLGQRLILTVSVKDSGHTKVIGCEIAGDPHAGCGVYVQHIR